MDQAELARAVHERLLEYYGYPQWREPLPPLDELISTILSQNTNDTNRDRAFRALRTRFESWEEVRDAAPSAVIEAIRPAGLANQKGPRIQRAAHRGRTALAATLQRSRPENRRHCAALLPGQAGFPGRYPYLQGDRAARDSP